MHEHGKATMTPSRHLDEAIFGDLQDSEMQILYWDIFGKCTASDLQKRIYGFIEPLVGKIRSCLFTVVSIGAVFGFETVEGSKFVFKVYPKRFSKESLQLIHQCQTRFYKLSYPAPNVLSDLITVGPDTHGAILEFISGDQGDGHEVEIRIELAHWLAEFSKLSLKEDFPLVTNPFQSKSNHRLWPVPHKSTIRLQKTSKGAGFIRDRAMKARKTVFDHSLNPMLAHLDWGVKNARFDHKKLKAVFDWDSLGTMSEAEMVGQAAAQFTADWETGTKITPSPEEAWSFLEEYQRSRIRRFSRQEMEVVSASADYIISLIARFEYAGKSASENSFVHLLRTLGKNPLIQI